MPRLWSPDFLRPEIGQVSPHFGAISFLNYTLTWRKGEKSTSRCAVVPHSVALCFQDLEERRRRNALPSSSLLEGVAVQGSYTVACRAAVGHKVYLETPIAHQNRTIAIASDFRVDGAKSPEILQKERVSGSEIATRNRKSLATFHRTLKLQCKVSEIASDFWGPRWASQSQIAKIAPISVR